MFEQVKNAELAIGFAFPIAEGIAMLIGIMIMRQIRKSELEKLIE